MTAFGYREDMFHGMTEEAVLSTMTEGKPLCGKVSGRMMAMRVKPEEMDNLVVFKTPPDEDSPAHMARENTLRDKSSRDPPTLLASLTDLLSAMFDAGEIRRFLGYQPGGEAFVKDLPGPNSSTTSIIHAAADKLIREGWLTRQLRNALVAERPRRASQIDAVFSM